MAEESGVNDLVATIQFVLDKGSIEQVKREGLDVLDTLGGATGRTTAEAYSNARTQTQASQNLTPGPPITTLSQGRQFTAGLDAELRAAAVRTPVSLGAANSASRETSEALQNLRESTDRPSRAMLNLARKMSGVQEVMDQIESSGRAWADALRASAAAQNAAIANLAKLDTLEAQFDKTLNKNPLFDQVKQPVRDEQGRFTASPYETVQVRNANPMTDRQASLAAEIALTQKDLDLQKMTIIETDKQAKATGVAAAQARALNSGFQGAAMAVKTFVLNTVLMSAVFATVLGGVMLIVSAVGAIGEAFVRNILDPTKAASDALINLASNAKAPAEIIQKLGVNNGPAVMLATAATHAQRLADNLKRALDVAEVMSHIKPEDIGPNGEITEDAILGGLDSANSDKIFMALNNVAVGKTDRTPIASNLSDVIGGLLGQPKAVEAGGAKEYLKQLKAGVNFAIPELAETVNAAAQKAFDEGSAKGIRGEFLQTAVLQAAQKAYQEGLAGITDPMANLKGIFVEGGVHDLARQWDAVSASIAAMDQVANVALNNLASGLANTTAQTNALAMAFQMTAAQTAAIAAVGAKIAASNAIIAEQKGVLAGLDEAAYNQSLAQIDNQIALARGNTGALSGAERLVAAAKAALSVDQERLAVLQRRVTLLGFARREEDLNNEIAAGSVGAVGMDSGDLAAQARSAQLNAARGFEDLKNDKAMFAVNEQIKADQIHVTSAERAANIENLVFQRSQLVSRHNANVKIDAANRALVIDTAAAKVLTDGAILAKNTLMSGVSSMISLMRGSGLDPETVGNLIGQDRDLLLAAAAVTGVPANMIQGLLKMIPPTTNLTGHAKGTGPTRAAGGYTDVTSATFFPGLGTIGEAGATERITIKPLNSQNEGGSQRVEFVLTADSNVREILDMLAVRITEKQMGNERLGRNIN